jgi:hypothetical protein
MSLKMITKVSEMGFKNQHLMKYVLFALANYANADDEAWPSYPTIAKFCSISERSAKQIVKKLVDQGYLIKTERVHENGRTRSNLYKFNLDRVNSVHPEGEQRAPTRVNSVHSINRNIEPSQEPYIVDFEKNSKDASSNVESVGEYRYRKVREIYPNGNGQESVIKKLNKMGKKEFNDLLTLIPVYLEFLKLCKDNGFNRRPKDLCTFINQKTYQEAPKLLEDAKKEYQSNEVKLFEM